MNSTQQVFAISDLIGMIGEYKQSMEVYDNRQDEVHKIRQAMEIVKATCHHVMEPTQYALICHEIFMLENFQDLIDLMGNIKTEDQKDFLKMDPDVYGIARYCKLAKEMGIEDDADILLLLSCLQSRALRILWGEDD